ncbi:hypothetical protein [Flavihumibacter solisilvae]|uniref:Rubredoxin-like domain-containing protein n=1 Tax=Flavihumibacter solisilvae TaxID=1349421 RepID=A0A0C1I9N1_9BACT|nr:hypothetical protein [Flavihumibacter solisilvae]KIC90720.1 hypothetical protein OI18_22750 [Flavihumibacter solisilvae]
MKSTGIIAINFRGGIISPGDLYNILVACRNAGVTFVRFGLRQQLVIEVVKENYIEFCRQLSMLNVPYFRGLDSHPNIMSSYPAEEVFIHDTWLSEGVYRDILDSFDYLPELKINVSDSNQSFTPMLTGNINWVAAGDSPHYWYCFIRFPKTNIVYESNELVYTNDLARMSRHIEQLIFKHADKFIHHASPDGDLLFSYLASSAFLTRKASRAAVLPAFNLPYYEGFNRYNNKYWLGIYQRDETFPVDFLQAVCRLCLDTKTGQICSTPWKSLIIKNIDKKDREWWNDLLGRYQVNVRHAANELNFQVEDNCADGLKLKHYLVRRLNEDDIRTFGLCIGIKTRNKSEVFSSILVRRRPLLKIGRFRLFHTYDILCAQDYNPNQRTGFIYSKNNPRWLLPEQLRRAVIAYYQQKPVSVPRVKQPSKEDVSSAPVTVYQCGECLTVYCDKEVPFISLPDTYACSLCDASKSEYRQVDVRSLGYQET